MLTKRTFSRKQASPPITARLRRSAHAFYPSLKRKTCAYTLIILYNSQHLKTRPLPSARTPRFHRLRRFRFIPIQMKKNFIQFINPFNSLVGFNKHPQIVPYPSKQSLRRFKSRTLSMQLPLMFLPKYTFPLQLQQAPLNRSISKQAKPTALHSPLGLTCNFLFEFSQSPTSS